MYQYVNGYAGNTLTLTAENGLAQPVRLVAVAITGDQFHGEIHGQAGLIYLLESSPDFAQWQLEQRLTAAADVVTVGQPILNEPARFFRVRLLP